MAEKLFIGGVEQDDERCLRCGSMHLDTGWECTDCGYDNQPHYYSPNQEPARHD
jgi:ribosomal protein S27AE